MRKLVSPRVPIARLAVWRRALCRRAGGIHGLVLKGTLIRSARRICERRRRQQSVGHRHLRQDRLSSQLGDAATPSRSAQAIDRPPSAPSLGELVSVGWRRTLCCPPSRATRGASARCISVCTRGHQHGDLLPMRRKARSEKRLRRPIWVMKVALSRRQWSWSQREIHQNLRKGLACPIRRGPNTEQQPPRVHSAPPPTRPWHITLLVNGNPSQHAGSQTTN
jgi:hypothetical protein